MEKILKDCFLEASTVLSSEARRLSNESER
jgi:hypothetical protein